MEKICAVIDLEGFYIKSRGGFHIRELGFCDWQCHRMGSRTYQTSGLFRDLPKEDRRAAAYVMKHIHGLSYSPRPWENARFPEDIEDDIRAIYQQAKTHQRDRLGYKGGCVERDLLARLNIPSHNLEDDGCPPFRKIRRLSRVQGCGLHQKPWVHHCPMVECVHFVQWMRRESGLADGTTPPQPVRVY